MSKGRRSGSGRGPIPGAAASGLLGCWATGAAFRRARNEGQNACKCNANVC